MPKSSARIGNFLRHARLCVAFACLQPGLMHGGDPAPPGGSGPVAGEPPGESAKPMVYVEAFRGDVGLTTAALVRKDLERGHVFELGVSDHAGSYTIGADATGGRVRAIVFDPGGRVLFTRLYESPSLRQNVHRLVDDFTEQAAHHPGIASSVIAFVSDRPGNRQVFVCDSDGQDISRVTHDSEIEAFEPTLALTAGKFMFTGSKRGFPDIYSIDLEVSESSPQRVINAPGDNRFPALSPDGKRLALTMSYSGTTDLYVTSAGGGQGRRLTSDALVESHPAWSPDGRSLVFTRAPKASPEETELVWISALGGEARVLGGIPGIPAEPDWAPGSNLIALTLASDGVKSLALFDIDKLETTVLADAKGGNSPSWAPDSRQLVYVSGNSLWIYDVENGSQSEIVRDFGNLSKPSWSR